MLSEEQRFPFFHPKLREDIETVRRAAEEHLEPKGAERALTQGAGRAAPPAPSTRTSPSWVASAPSIAASGRRSKRR